MKQSSYTYCLFLRVTQWCYRCSCRSLLLAASACGFFSPKLVGSFQDAYRSLLAQKPKFTIVASFHYTGPFVQIYIAGWFLYTQSHIRVCGKRTRHMQVININNINNFLLPEAVCCCLQTCNFCFDETLSEYISVQ